MRTANRRASRLRQAEVLHLSLLGQVLDGARHVLDGHLRVDAVLIVEVDAVRLQASQLGLRYPLDVFGAAVETPALAARCDLEAELGGNDDTVAKRRQGLADELLTHEGAVDLGGVEERDTALVRS